MSFSARARGYPAMVEAMEESYGGSTQESSGVSVVRPNTSLLGDPCDVVVALILWGLIYSICGRISQEKNLLHNQGRAPSLPLDRKLKRSSVSLSVGLVNRAYLRANIPIRCSPLTKVTALS